MPKPITPFLWFDDQAEEAARFYLSVFKDGKILKVFRNPGTAPGRKGSVLTVSFRIRGQEFIALNGGPHFKFSEAVSFVVECATQREVDYFWKKLSAGGRLQQCGWLNDKYGLAWQIVPTALFKLTQSKDEAQNARVFGAMMQMVKLDIKGLERAAAAKPSAQTTKAKAKGRK